MRRVEFFVKARKIFGRRRERGRWERKFGKFDLADG